VETVTLIEQDLEIIPVSDIIDLGINRDVHFMIMDQRDGTMVYSIIDNFDSSNEVFYNFASHHDLSNQAEVSEGVLIIKDIPRLQAYPGFQFEYHIEKYIEDVTFTDYTNLFDITPEGLVSFIPEISNKGEHNILIKATDSQGREDYAFMILEVIHDNPPIIQHIPNQVIKKGEYLSYSVDATDSDNDALFFSISGLPDTAIHPLTGIISYETTETLEKMVDVTVVDINSNTAIESFTLKVIE
jgi:hypothetical protein